MDLNPQEQEQNKSRFITTRGIIVTGWLMLMMMCIVILGANVYMWVTMQTPPEALINWGSSVIGFLFGTFITLLKEFMGDD